MKRENITDESLILSSILGVGLFLGSDSFYWKLFRMAPDCDKYPLDPNRSASERIDCKLFYHNVCEWGFEVLYE